MTSVNEQTPLLHSCQQYTPQSIENDPHTAAILRQSSRVLSEINEDILSGAYIFKEAVQSPLPWLSDKGVFAVRVVLAAVMTAMQGEYWWLECQRGNGRIFWFRFGNLVWAAQCYYMWLVAVSHLSSLLHAPALSTPTNTPPQSSSGPSSAPPPNSPFHTPSAVAPASATVFLLLSLRAQPSPSSFAPSTRSSRRSPSQPPSSTSSSSSPTHRPRHIP